MSMINYKAKHFNYKTDNGIARKRPQIVWINHIHQGLTQLWKLIIQFLANPGVQEGNPLNNALNVWVACLIIRQLQACGHLGKLFGKGFTPPFQVVQLTLVVIDQYVAHRGTG